MAAEHPYHTLYHVHALSRGDQVGGSGHHYSMPCEKINAAAEVLATYKKRSHGGAVQVVVIQLLP
jgi:hypothetical protein